MQNTVVGRGEVGLKWLKKNEKGKEIGRKKTLKNREKGVCVEDVSVVRRPPVPPPPTKK